MVWDRVHCTHGAQGIFRARKSEHSVHTLFLTDIVQAHKHNNNTELFLPAPNPYIPQDLSVNKRDVSQVRPVTMPSRDHGSFAAA